MNTLLLYRERDDPVKVGLVNWRTRSGTRGIGRGGKPSSRGSQPPSNTSTTWPDAELSRDEYTERRGSRRLHCQDHPSSGEPIERGKRNTHDWREPPSGRSAMNRSSS